MEYLALYRKYRPKELDEVVGQSEIKKILASSVKNGTITHAYLFSGPRGTGKTTMAKILAKMVNCLEPVDGNACNKCEICQNILNSNDVIEIDAASNNGVDEIRDLREKANLVPSSAKYKVYIIDEVHMLTTQAFNALLKTLEEPPKHVIFILATTEYYKIPLTITSRCQKFQFCKISNQDIFDRLKTISKLEGIDITDDALFEIAKISDGGMRDSINFLDQLRSFNENKITIEDVYEVCGNVSSDEIVALLESLRNSNYEKITEFFENMDISGKNYAKFLENLVGFLKDVILFNRNVSQKYIKSDLDSVEKINNLFSLNEILIITEYVNDLMEKLKNMSRQLIVIVTNFLILMNRINKTVYLDDQKNNIDYVDDESNSMEDSKYDMAFQFTPSEQKKDIDENNDTVDNVNNVDNIDENNDDEYKEIILNNTFAVANKEKKKNLQEMFKKIEDYLTDAKYKATAGTLIDTKIEVAGNNYIIFSSPNEAIVQKVYDDYQKCQELLNLIFQGEYNFVVLSNEVWCKYRDEYINNFKNGKKYVLKELKRNKKEKEKVKKKPTVVDKLFELVGEDNIEFK